MAEKVIGRPISQDVVNQILKRQEKLGSKNRDNDTLFFMNSNNSWIKLSSGANTVSQNQILTSLENQISGVEDAVVEGDSTLAKESVLGGSQNKSGISLTSYNPVTRVDGLVESVTPQTSALYRNTNSRGFRPAPGITGVSVKSKGTYGTLRETEVKFVVWSLEDLDVLELMYLRPGFSMLLEWGHTTYFTSEGEFRTATSTINTFFDKYKSDPKESSQSLIQKEIKKLRESSNYNYDGLFGYVKNFNWSFRPDGGYDCSISIASVGSLIEGLRADIGIQNINPDDIERDESQEHKDALKSPFHFLFTYMDKSVKGKEYTRKTVKTYSTDDSIPRQVRNMATKLSLQDTFIYSKRVDVLTPWYMLNKKTNLFYMPIGVLFDIINKFMTLKTQEGVTLELYTGAQDTSQIVGTDYEIEAKYATSEYHFSVDPFRVQLPFSPIIPKSVFQGLGTTLEVSVLGSDFTTDESELVENHLGKHYFLDPNDSKRKPFSDSIVNRRGGNDDILNILVTSNIILELFERNLDEKDSQNRDVRSILDNLATILTDELGGVNEFGYHFDEVRNLFILVDRKNTPTEEGDFQYPQITLTGLNNTIESLSISSKLSSKVASQIAIAAQGSNINYQENVSEILKWNTGVVDRHGVGGTYNTEGPIVGGVPKEEVDRRRGWLKTAARVYKTNGYTKGYDPSHFTELKVYHRVYTSVYVLDDLIAKGQAEKGIIPIELSFTMLGLSGIDIAQSFKISPGVLPTKYSGAFGFIVTGLEHTIGTRWTTTVRTQFYVLQEPSELIKKSKQAFLEPPSRPNQTADDLLQLIPTLQGDTPNADRLRAVLPILGYLENLRELSSGGDITSQTADMGIAVLRRLKQVLPEGTTITLTAGNDLYHQKLTDPSRHKSGRALDFKVTPNNDTIIKLIEDELKIFMLVNDPNFRYLNEYKKLTKNANGFHFHISLGVGTEAADTLANVRATLPRLPYGPIYTLKS